MSGLKERRKRAKKEQPRKRLPHPAWCTCRKCQSDNEHLLRTKPGSYED